MLCQGQRAFVVRLMTPYKSGADIIAGTKNLIHLAVMRMKAVAMVALMIGFVRIVLAMILIIKMVGAITSIAELLHLDIVVVLGEKFQNG